MRLQTRWTLLLLPMLVIGCSEDSNKSTTETDTTADGSADTATDTGAEGSGDTATDTAVNDGSAEACPEQEALEGDAVNPDCDPLNDGHCAMPWPSNLYLTDDAATATGKRLNFGATTLPKNFQNVHIDPAPYARRDGYSVGTPLLVRFPNLDTTGMATERDLTPSLADDAKVLWFKVAADGTLSRGSLEAFKTFSKIYNALGIWIALVQTAEFTSFTMSWILTVEYSRKRDVFTHN